jgi:hypothetical protein
LKKVLKVVNQKLVDWIKNQISKGHSSQELYKILVDRGHDSNEIKEAIDFVYDKGFIKVKGSQKKNYTKIILIVVAIVVVVGLVSYFFVIKGMFSKVEVIHVGSEFKQDIVAPEGEKIGEFEMDFEGDVEVVTDCGDMNCFEENFANCNPSTLT